MLKKICFFVDKNNSEASVRRFFQGLLKEIEICCTSLKLKALSRSIDKYKSKKVTFLAQVKEKIFAIETLEAVVLRSKHSGLL